VPGGRGGRERDGNAGCRGIGFPLVQERAGRLTFPGYWDVELLEPPGFGKPALDDAAIAVRDLFSSPGGVTLNGNREEPLEGLGKDRSDGAPVAVVPDGIMQHFTS